MKKISCILAAIMTICLCIPLASCDNNDNKTETPTKRIVGLDSEKTYAKGVIYLENQNSLNGVNVYLEILSYDKIENKELKDIKFELSRYGNESNIGNAYIVADKYELEYQNYNKEKECYNYLLNLSMTAKYFFYELNIKTIILTISGREYNFSSDITFKKSPDNNVYVKPLTYGKISHPEKGEYGLAIKTRYDTVLNNLKFQTDGFEIVTYYIEKFNGYDSQGYLADGEKVGDKLPVTLKANVDYSVFVKAIPPKDCLYYTYNFEAIIEVSGQIINYNNVADTDTVIFKGAAFN